MSIEIPSIISQFIIQINKSLDIPISTLETIFSENNSQCEDLYSKKINELKHLCELHGVTKHGNKHELIEKINSTTNPQTSLYLKSTPALKHMCKEYGLKVTGNKHDLVDRIFNHPNFSNDNESSGDDETIVTNYIESLCSLNKNINTLKKRELIELCKQKGIDSKGSKQDLISRLNNL